jgi:hypothetical protein
MPLRPEAIEADNSRLPPMLFARIHWRATGGRPLAALMVICAMVLGRPGAYLRKRRLKIGAKHWRPFDAAFPAEPEGTEMFDTIELTEGFTSLCGPNAGKQRRAVHPRRPRLPGNPYDGHTLTARSSRPSGSPASRSSAYVDRGYRSA